MKPFIVGLVGPAKSGKTFLSGYFDSLNYHPMSLAAPLKEASSYLFGYQYSQLYGEHKETLDNQGYTPRQRLQALGDFCKDTYGQDFFCQTLKREIDAHGLDKVIIDDVRFAVEAEAIRSWGGILIGVRNPSVYDEAMRQAMDPDYNLHRSEAEMMHHWKSMVDYEIYNYGGPELFESFSNFYPVLEAYAKGNTDQAVLLGQYARPK